MLALQAKETFLVFSSYMLKTHLQLHENFDWYSWDDEGLRS